MMKFYVIALVMVCLLSSIGFAAQTVNSVSMCTGTACTAISTTLYTTDTLNCKANITDSYSTTINSTLYLFYKGAVNYVNVSVTGGYGGNFTNSSAVYLIPASDVTKGDTWKCEARGWNGTDWTAGTTSTAVTVNNTIPVVSAVTVTRNPSQLYCGFSFTDADSDPIGITYYVWYKGGVAVVGGTHQTLSVVNGDDGTYNCSAKAEDTGYAYTNSTIKMSSAYVFTYYNIVNLDTVTSVLGDMGQFISDAITPIIQVFVLVIVLGGTISLITAILYAVFTGIQGSFKEWK